MKPSFLKNHEKSSHLTQEQRVQKVTRIIQKRFGPPGIKRKLYGINTTELNHLSTFIRAADTKSTFSNIRFYNSSFEFSPNKLFDREIIKFLADASLIYMFSIPQNYTEIIESESDLDNIDLFMCHYTLNLVDDMLGDLDIWNTLYYPQKNLFLKDYIARKEQ